VEALRLDLGNGSRELTHRQRLGAVLRQCPKLVAIGVHRSMINDIALSPGGDHLVTASADGTARVWEANTGQSQTLFLRHGDVVNTACFTPDGDQVLTGSDDGTAQLWNVQTSEPAQPP